MDRTSLLFLWIMNDSGVLVAVASSRVKDRGGGLSGLSCYGRNRQVIRKAAPSQRNAAAPTQ
jgi:hypothetical protein